MATSYSERMSEWGEFTEIGISLFDSEELTNNLISIYLSLMATGWRGRSVGTPLPIDQIGKLYMNGLSLSCVKRVAISGQIDTRNDGVPEFAAIPVQKSCGDFDFVVYDKVEELPKGWTALPFSQHLLWSGLVFRDKMHNRRDRRVAVGMEPLSIDSWYYSVLNDKIFSCRRAGWPNGGPAADLAAKTAAAVQTVSDLKCLWNVETVERPILGTDTPLRLGIDAEIVKSLFYARQAPIAESGRRRPILHWVRAHNRRLRDGIDIDIREHLRGVTEFEMDGFPFRITSPTKELKNAA